MDEMAQISDILTTGSAASLGTVEEQQALEAELCELLEQENVAATNVPSTVEVPVSVSANETELPVAPVSRTIHHLVDSNKVKIGFSAPAPHLA